MKQDNETLNTGFYDDVVPKWREMQDFINLWAPFMVDRETGYICLSDFLIGELEKKYNLSKK